MLKRIHDDHVSRRGRSRNPRQQKAQRAWRLLMKVAERRMVEVDARLMEMGLSPVMAHFLAELALMEPGPMSQLVARMDVDPGWVTDIVDRLEERGDVVRKPSPDDRRVKILELTDKGRETWRQMDDLIATAPPRLADLSLIEIETFLKVAEHLARAAKVEAEPPF